MLVFYKHTNYYVHIHNRLIIYLGITILFTNCNTSKCKHSYSLISFDVALKAKSSSVTFTAMRHCAFLQCPVTAHMSGCLIYPIKTLSLRWVFRPILRFRMLPRSVHLKLINFPSLIYINSFHSVWNYG